MSAGEKKKSFKLDSQTDTSISPSDAHVLVFLLFTGDCINSSPAGKRRIAAEKQLSQLADEGNLFNSDAALMDGTVDGGESSTDQIKSPVAFVALVGVAICAVFVIVFVTVFTVLQVSWGRSRTSSLSIPRRT